MPKKKCPVKGHETFEIEFPDEFLVRDYEKFTQGMAQARVEKKFNDESPVNTARFYGCKAVCSIFTGEPDKPISEWPLSVFLWFMNAVYYGDGGLDKALNPPKN